LELPNVNWQSNVEYNDSALVSLVNLTYIDIIGLHNNDKLLHAEDCPKRTLPAHPPKLVLTAISELAILMM
jgi:hypothetical protein